MRSEDLAGCVVYSNVKASQELEVCWRRVRVSGGVVEACVSGFCVEVNHRGR